MLGLNTHFSCVRTAFSAQRHGCLVVHFHGPADTLAVSKKFDLCMQQLKMLAHGVSLQYVPDTAAIAVAESQAWQQQKPGRQAPCSLPTSAHSSASSGKIVEGRVMLLPLVISNMGLECRCAKSAGKTSVLSTGTMKEGHNTTAREYYSCRMRGFP